MLHHSTLPFKVKKKIVLVEIPYCLENKSSSKQFIEKFDKFIDDKFDDVQIIWLTKKDKDKLLHQACKIYKGFSYKFLQ